MKNPPENIDWNMTNKALSELHGGHHTGWSKLRKKLGAHKANRLRAAIKIPGEIDWTMSSYALAEKFGVSQATILNHRKRLGLPGVRENQANLSRKLERLQKENQELRNKVSERATVHQWLNGRGVPDRENGKPICLLRRLAIALDVENEPAINNSLLKLVLDIREAAGDPHGRLMQDELVQSIKTRFSKP